MHLLKKGRQTLEQRLLLGREPPMIETREEVASTSRRAGGRRVCMLRVGGGDKVGPAGLEVDLGTGFETGLHSLVA
jgi:hypothetical protein